MISQTNVRAFEALILSFVMIGAITVPVAGFVPLHQRGDVRPFVAKTSKRTSTAAPYSREAPPLKVSLSSPYTATFATRKSVSWDWKSVAENVFENDQRPVILFDGVCNLCNAGVNFVLDHDIKANFRFVSMQSKTGISLLLQAGRDPYDMSSIVVVENCNKANKTENQSTTIWSESDAILRISRGLEGSFFMGIGILGFLIPRLIRDAMYHVVSNNRYRFGERDSCRMDFDGEYENRFVSDPEGLF